MRTDANGDMVYKRSRCGSNSASQPLWHRFREPVAISDKWNRSWFDHNHVFARSILDDTTGSAVWTTLGGRRQVRFVGSRQDHAPAGGIPRKRLWRYCWAFPNNVTWSPRYPEDPAQDTPIRCCAGLRTIKLLRHWTRDPARDAPALAKASPSNWIMG